MHANKKVFHQKDLLLLGYKAGQISVIVDRADIFQGIEKKQGYAIDYSFNQVVFLAIGCELLSLGVSFRHVNEVLFQISGLNFEKEGADFVKHNVCLLVGVARLCKNQIKQYKGFKGEECGVNIATGKRVVKQSRLRTQSLAAWPTHLANVSKIQQELPGLIIIQIFKLIISLTSSPT